MDDSRPRAAFLAAHHAALQSALSRAVNAAYHSSVDDPITAVATFGALVRALGACFWPGLFNSVTTSIGFLAFLAAPMQVVRHLGAFAGLGADGGRARRGAAHRQQRPIACACGTRQDGRGHAAGGGRGGRRGRRRRRWSGRLVAGRAGAASAGAMQRGVAAREQAARVAAPTA